MKAFLLRFPEVLGLGAGLLDAVPRAIAATVYAPAAATVHGPLLIGNVHHVNGTRAFGLDSMAWFAASGAALAALYLALRVAARPLDPHNVAYLFARGLFGAMAGVLLLNVAESLLTGKVTDYVGLVYGGRFTAVNFGDLLLWMSLLALVPSVTGAFALHVVARPRVGG